MRVDKAAVFNQIKGGIKKTELPKKYQPLFDLLNSDNNDVLDSMEVTSDHITSFFKALQAQNPEFDTDGFTTALVNASKNIKASRTTVNSDGTKIVETIYDDTLETTIYYPDGEIKMRKQLKMTVNNLNQTSDKILSSRGENPILAKTPVNNNTPATHFVSKTEFSPRAEEELRNFTGDEFLQSVDSYYNQITHWGERNGDLTHVGQAINDGGHQLFASATGGEYKTHAELYSQAQKNKENAGLLNFAAMADPNSPYAKANGINFEQTYHNITGQDYDIEKVNKFQQTAVKYHTVTALKQKTELLNKGFKEVELLLKEEELRKSGITTPNRDKTFDEVFVNTLTEYFDGDSEAAAAFIGEISESVSREELSSKMKDILKEIRSLTQKRYESELGKENYETLKDRYKQQYKNIFGVDHLQDDIEKNILDGAQTTGMLKMGVVIASSILLGGSNLVAQGGKALAERLGPNVAAQAIKLGMSFGSITESYGLELLDAMSSKEDLTSEKHSQILEGQKVSLPFILFGMYVSGPVGNKVSGLLKSNPEVSNNILNKAFSNGSSYVSEVSADAVFELLTRGGETDEIFGENAQGEAFGRIMNAIVGGRNHAAARNALKGVNIYQQKMPDGTVEYYAQKKKGQVFRTKNPDEIVGGLLATAAESVNRKLNSKTPDDINKIIEHRHSKSNALANGEALPETNTESRIIDAQTLESQKFKSEAEIEDFLNDYNQKCKNNGAFLTSSAIHSLIDTIKKYPEMGGYVKLWAEDKNIKPRIFRKLIEQYDLSPQQTIEFLGMKNSDGSYRFSLNDIADNYLIENSIDYPEITDYFLNLKNPDGTFYLTNTHDIDYLVWSSASNPDYKKIIEEYQHPDGSLLKPDTYRAMISSGYSNELIGKIISHKLNENDISAMLSLNDLDKLSDDELSLVANDLMFQEQSNNTSWKNDITERLNNNIYQKINHIIQENVPDETFIGIRVSHFYKNAIEFATKDSSGNITELTMDNNGKLLRNEKKVPNKKPLPKMRTQTNTNSNIINYTYSNFYDNSTKIVKDNDGNVLFKEYYQKSGVKNRYNIYRTENGKEYIVGLAEKTPAGNVVVEKTITSPDGTKNDYVYGQDANDSRFVYNKITDSNGNVLFENRRKLKIIDNDHIQTTENDVNYDMQFDFFNDKMTVSILDGNNNVVDTVTHEFGNETGQIAPELYTVMKQLPGELFFKMRDLGFNKMTIDKSERNKNNAYYANNGNIFISPEMKKQDGAFTILHEFGHFIDDKYNLCRNKELLKIFEEEKSNYLNLTSNKELSNMQYFIDELHKNDGGAITEVIAETYALMHTLTNDPDIILRGEYLQQYFPKTMAYIMNSFIGF